MPRGGKTYTGIITQTGTATPEVQIFTNTIGNIIWTRDDVGIYTGTLNGAFPENKKLLPPFTPDSPMVIPLFNSIPADYYYSLTSTSTDNLTLRVYAANGDPAELSTATAGFGLLIQINIYP